MTFERFPERSTTAHLLPSVYAHKKVILHCAQEENILQILKPKGPKYY
jgi:hypothetical protein